MEEYRIKLLRLPPNANGAPEVPEGYYGPVSGVGMNHYIYSRVPRERAFIFDRRGALEAIRFLRHACRCEPPITVTY